MAEQKLLQDADLKNPTALMSLNVHILDYLKTKGFKSSSNAFEEELFKSKTNDHQRTVKVISGLLLSKWNSCVDADCLKDQAGSSDDGRASSTRLDGYISSYLASQDFKDTSDAFHQEANVIQGSNLKDDFLFTKFWIPKVFSISKEGQIPEPSKMGNSEKKIKSSTCGEKGERPTFSVSLSPREIAEDFLAMTGQSLPPRPKKRPQDIQKLLDRLFPGSGLEDISPHDYKQQESTHKTEDIESGPSAKSKRDSRNQAGPSSKPKRDSSEDFQTGPSTRPKGE